MYRRLSEEERKEKTERSGLTQPIYPNANSQKQIHKVTKETLTFQPCAAWLSPTSKPCAVTVSPFYTRAPANQTLASESLLLQRAWLTRVQGVEPIHCLQSVNVLGTVPGGLVIS